MKLAEALQIRADLQNRIEQIGTRLVNNATTQEGSEPAESPAELLNELNASLEKHQELVTRINITNSRECNDKGETLTQLIARRDMLQKKSADAPKPCRCCKPAYKPLSPLGNSRDKHYQCGRYAKVGR